MLTDYDLAVFLSSSGPCSLATTPQKDNWVDHSGHLPNYICHIAKHVAESGHDISSAIAIAVSTVKRWAHGGTTNGHPDAHGVTAATAAKAARAVAEWEALKAKAHAGHMVKASNPMHFGQDLIVLASSDSYNLEIVREAWANLQNMDEAHADEPEDPKEEADEESKEDPKEEATETPEQESAEEATEPRSFSVIKEIWSDFVIVEVFGPADVDHYKVPYEVHDGEDVHFGEPVRVKQDWTEQPADELNDDELEMLKGELAHQDDEVKLSGGPRTVRTPGGQLKYHEGIGAPIVKDAPKETVSTPTSYQRLISLYREYKGFVQAGAHEQAQHALGQLRAAISHFPKSEKNQAALDKLHKLLEL